MRCTALRRASNLGRVWLVRHAPTTLKGTCYGQSDVPVSPAPAEAAELVGQRWAAAGMKVPPSEVWSSPWARTRSLAIELARLWQIPWHVDARLSELSFGVWEGREYSEIEGSDALRWERWLHNYELEAPPRGETVAQLRARVTAWLEERSAKNATVLAVTHAGVVRTARAVVAGLAYSAVVADAVPHLCPERIG